MRDPFAAISIVVALDAFALLGALILTAALGSGTAQHVALLGFAVVYVVATWRALGRFAEDRAWTAFQRNLVYALGHFLTLRFVLEIAAMWMFGLHPEA